MTPKTYTYQDLPSDPGSVRLLRVQPPQNDGMIRCELTVGNVNTSRYKALSYVWGSSHETFPVKLDDEPWSVRRSLLNFLGKAQNDYTNQPLWIDALCINQNDIPERNQQVSQMCQIYSQAELVLVWLEDDLSSFELFPNFSAEGDWTGPVSARQNVPNQEAIDIPPGDFPILCAWTGWNDPEESAADTIFPFDSGLDSLEPWSESDKETARAIFTEVSHHSYWTRSWVVQEFCLAKDILFVFQSTELSFLKFERAFLLTDPDDASDTLVKPMEGFSEVVFWRQGVYQAVSEDTKKEHPIDLHELLVTFGSRNCQGVRDRVFSLIGVSEESQDFRVDYGQNKLQLFVSVLHFLNKKARRRFYTAIVLIELLELSLSEITSNMCDLPVLNLTYELASSFLVVNDTGGVARSRQLWTFQCHQCHHLAQLFHPEDQIILVRTPLPSLWLLYSFKEWTIAEISDPGNSEAYFKCVACAAPMHDDRDVGQKLYAFVPEHPLLKLYHDSQLSLKNDGHNATKIHLNERSIFTHAFCASLFGSTSASQIGHSSMVTPVEAEGHDYGALGIVHYEWDWARHGVDGSDGRITTSTGVKSLRSDSEDQV